MLKVGRLRFLIGSIDTSSMYQKLPMLPKSVLTVFKVCYLCLLLGDPHDA